MSDREVGAVFMCGGRGELLRRDREPDMGEELMEKMRDDDRRRRRDGGLP